MAISTSQKRERYPLKYLRKDARTMIYRALYGVQEWRKDAGKRSNVPAIDPTRRLAEGWNWHDANQALNVHLPHADFTPQQLNEIEDRLTQLKRAKREG